MKRINKHSLRTWMLLCLSFLIAVACMGQSTSENYIAKRTYIDTQGRYVTNIQYFDGLGRPYRQVQKDAVSPGVDLVTATWYDSQNRDSIVWLPVKGRNGLPLTDAEIRTQAAALYNNDSRAYSQNLYEPSALNRISKSYGPGAAWAAADKAVNTSYHTNSATDSRLVCRKYVAKDEITLEKQGNYPAASLHVTEVSDEDGHPVLTFTNSLGQVLLIRTFSDGNADPLDTYYVYDGHGMLCWVLPPLAADAMATDGTYSWKSPVIDRYAYYYRYDGRQQLIVKKLPGAERIETIYDLAGRVALIEDGNLRAQRRMQYFYYDVFGNVREMGLCSLLPHQTLDYYRNYISRNRYAVQGPTASSYMEERKGLNVIENVTPLQYYWYDTYDFLSSPGFSGNPNFTASTENAKGKLTGSQATVFGSSDVIRTVYHYDRKGRLSKTTSNNLVGGYDTETLTYTFTNQIKTKERVHTSSRLTSAQTELYTFTYDDWGKLLTTTHKLNSNPAVTLASYTYDALGRNSKKTVNNGSYASTYSYNIRSWLEKIEGAKFTQQLYYHTGSGTPCYNGNISSMTWKAGGESVLRGYKFSYDGLNRLTSSVYGEGSSIASNLNRYTENMTYDKMGNILSIKRYGKLNATSFGLIDDLSLSYTGNQLQKVTDQITQAVPEGVMHFTDGNNSNTEYTYDSNGNLLSDLNKNISKIEYNILNLPEKITFSNGDWTGYVYDSGGKKLRVTHHIGQTTSVTDYAGSMIYENGILSKTLTKNGYVSFSGTTPAYHYYLTDHLGNNRIVMNAAGSIEQVNHYYPFGGIIAESSGQETQAWKFNGKELDSSSGLNHYDYGSRFYDPVIGRWSVPDKYSEKYYSLSPYQFVAGNPIRNIDIKGDSINIKAVSKYDEENGTHYAEQIISDLKDLTGLDLYVSETGTICYRSADNNGSPTLLTKKDKDGNEVVIGSETARNHLSKLIRDDGIPIKVGIKGKNSYTLQGGNRIYLSASQINNFIKGTVGADSKTLGWGMTLLHETFHTGLGGSYEDGNPGPVVQKMNIIRTELNKNGGNYGQRLSYPPYNVSGDFYIPFNESTQKGLEKGNIPSNIDGAFIRYR